MAEAEGRLTRSVTLLRETAALFRELAIVAAFALLLLWPHEVRQILKNAGIHSAFGVEFDELEQVAVENAATKAKLEAINKGLEQLEHAKTDDKDMRRQVQQLRKQTLETQQALDQSTQKLNQLSTQLKKLK